MLIYEDRDNIENINKHRMGEIDLNHRKDKGLPDHLTDEIHLRRLILQQNTGNSRRRLRISGEGKLSSSDNDIYISPSQIRRFICRPEIKSLVLQGHPKCEKFKALLYVKILMGWAQILK